MIMNLKKNCCKWGILSVEFCQKVCTFSECEVTLNFQPTKSQKKKRKRKWRLKREVWHLTIDIDNTEDINN